MVRHRSKNRARTRKNIKYPPQIDAVIQHAINLHKMGALNEAESIYRKILTEYPQHADANHLIGVCCYAKKDYQSAMAFISAGLRESPHNAEFMHNLALVYKDSNRPEEAKKLLQSAIKENASYSSAYNSLGSIYLQEGNIANSVVQFKKAVKLITCLKPIQKVKTTKKQYHYWHRWKHYETYIEPIKSVLKPLAKILRLREIKSATTVALFISRINGLATVLVRSSFLLAITS